MGKLLRTKSVESMIAESEGKSGLKKVLGPVDLTMLGIGAIIGTGIFVLTGVAAAEHAGPALVLSFIVSALVCGFAALVYAELASTVPVAGSAYTYSYATLGELLAWIIGWDLILEYLLACSTVAIGWSGYFQSLLAGFGIHLPAWAAGAPGSAAGAIVNIPAIIISLIITSLLAIGIKEATRFNNAIVVIKLAAVLLFIFVGVRYVKPANWTPFLPFGIKGVLSGAAVVFFAYLGFDSVSTAAEEVKNPEKDMPIGIIASLVICTVLYIAVSLILTGIVPYQMLDVPAPVALALQYIHQDWAAGIISLAALGGITTVLLVMMYGQTRIFFAMSRDGLLPRVFSKVHPNYKTPFISTWIVGIVVTLVAGFTKINVVAELVNIGTLSAFVFVSIGVIVLRKTRPNLHRAFRVPGVPYVPILSALFCVFLMVQLPVLTWIRFVVWLLIGLVVYFAYGIKHSALNQSVDYKSKIAK
ncbi:MAG: amino acid permease [Bacillota bacterium]|nr:amino acid permease [Bacillota bacterium]